MAEQNNAWKITGVVNGAIALCIAAAFMYTRDDAPPSPSETSVPEESAPEHIPSKSEPDATQPTAPSVDQPLETTRTTLEENLHSFSGKVTDKKGQPIPDVLVELTGKTDSFIFTDAKGKFVFPVVNKGRHEVFLQKNNWGEQREKIKIPRDKSQKFIFLRNVRYKGNVFETGTDNAIERISLAAFDAKGDEISLGKNDEIVIFDENGYFDIVAPENVKTDNVRFFSSGYESKHVPASALSTSTLNRIALDPKPDSHEGIVYSPDGQPLPGAYIYSGRLTQDVNPQTGAAGMSDKLGRFRFGVHTEHEDQPFLLFANHSDFAPAMFRTTRAQLTDQPITITLNKPSSLTVHATADGKPIPLLSFDVYFLNQVFFSEWKGITDKTGSARMDGIPPGDATLIAEFPTDFAWSDTGKIINNKNDEYKFAQNILIERGKSQEIYVRFQTPNAALTGTVFSGGVSVPPGGEVQLALQGQNGAKHFSSDIDDNGNFSFESVPAGKGTLLYFAEDDEQIHIHEFDTRLEPGLINRHDLEIQTGTSSLGIHVSGTRDSAILLLYEGVKSADDNLGAGLYSFLMETVESDVRFLCEVDEHGGEMPIVVPNLTAGKYTAVVIQLEDWFIVNEFAPHVRHTIDLKDNEYKELEYVLD